MILNISNDFVSLLMMFMHPGVMVVTLSLELCFLLIAWVPRMVSIGDLIANWHFWTSEHRHFAFFACRSLCTWDLHIDRRFDAFLNEFFRKWRMDATRETSRCTYGRTRWQCAVTNGVPSGPMPPRELENLAKPAHHFLHILQTRDISPFYAD
jgi:hypothetical protein